MRKTNSTRRKALIIKVCLFLNTLYHFLSRKSRFCRFFAQNCMYFSINFLCAKSDWTSLREANALKLWEYEVLTSTTYWESLRHIGHFHEKYERLLWRNFRFFSQYTLIFRSIFWGKTAPKKFCPEILEILTMQNEFYTTKNPYI